MNKKEKKIHYGIEFGDLRKFGGEDYNDFVSIPCRKFSNSLKKDYLYTSNAKNVNCKKCSHLLNKSEEVK